MRNDATEIVYPNKLTVYLHEYYYRFCKNEDEIDSYIQKSPQNTFHGCMRYLYNKLIKDNYIVKDSNSRYIIENLEYLLAIYLDLCMVYDKAVTVCGYAYLIGTNTDQFTALCGDINNNLSGNLKGELSVRFKLILKQLISEREGSLAAKLTASKGNMLGLLAVQNHYHNWNAPGISYDDTRKAALDASQLPQLGANTINSIADQQELPENLP